MLMSQKVMAAYMWKASSSYSTGRLCIAVLGGECHPSVWFFAAILGTDGALSLTHPLVTSLDDLSRCSATAIVLEIEREIDSTAVQSSYIYTQIRVLVNRAPMVVRRLCHRLIPIPASNHVLNY